MDADDGCNDARSRQMLQGVSSFFPFLAISPRTRGCVSPGRVRPQPAQRFPHPHTPRYPPPLGLYLPFTHPPLPIPLPSCIILTPSRPTLLRGGSISQEGGGREGWVGGGVSMSREARGGGRERWVVGISLVQLKIPNSHFIFFERY